MASKLVDALIRYVAPAPPVEIDPAVAALSVGGAYTVEHRGVTITVSPRNLQWSAAYQCLDFIGDIVLNDRKLAIEVAQKRIDEILDLSPLKRETS